MRAFAVAVVGDTAPSELLTQFQAEYLERWIEDADAVFHEDLIALQRWAFAEDDLAKIEQPVLNIRGEHTLPFFRQAYLTLQKRLPHCESLIVPRVSHVLLQLASRVVAQRLVHLCMAMRLKNFAGLIPLERTAIYWIPVMVLQARPPKSTWYKPTSQDPAGGSFPTAVVRDKGRRKRWTSMPTE